MGIREVTKHLKLQKLKCVILAPNCEKIQSKGGLDDAINFIIQNAMEQNIPFVFALGRKGLGKSLNKLVPISVVGIFDYSGAEEYFKRLVQLAENAKHAYQEIVEECEKEECENLIMMQSELSLSSSSSVVHQSNTAAAVNADVHVNNLLNDYRSLASNMATGGSSVVGMNPIIPAHMGHSRTASNSSNISIDPAYFHMNYHHHPHPHSSHSRSASGNYNFSGAPSLGGHSRSASGGGQIDLSFIGATAAASKHWTHSRTPSNCSNISFISRLSEPISEVGTILVGSCTTSSTNLSAAFLLNPSVAAATSNYVNPANLNSALASLAAVQHYTDQVRQEMRETNEQQQQQQSTTSSSSNTNQQMPVDSASTAATVGTTTTTTTNLQQLGSINEIDAGNEADTEDACNDPKKSD
jgi:ribosomal protein L7Ae-like RNA K-turn-binding protein